MLDGNVLSVNPAPRTGVELGVTSSTQDVAITIPPAEEAAPVPPRLNLDAVQKTKGSNT
jgi:hypothetical protein